MDAVTCMMPYRRRLEMQKKILNPRREYRVTNMKELAFLLKKYAKADILVTIIGDYVRPEVASAI